MRPLPISRCLRASPTLILRTSLTINSKLKARWIAALLSGEYKQGKEALYNNLDDSYCCLGVLLHIGGANGAYDDVVKLLGGCGYSKYVCWNDHCGLSFAEIADKIEQGD